jgi:hypothetical protein
MKLTISILAAVTMTFFCNCKGKEEATARAITEDTEEIASAEQSEVQALSIDFEYSPRETDGFMINEVSLDGVILTVIVQYSGGCKNHEFKLISNQRYMKSMPPQLPLYLEHQANNDNCRALVIQTLKFDVTKAKYSGSPSCRLLVNGSREHEVIYEYGK